MVILFYVSALVAIIATLCVILNNHPVHALLYLVLSLLSVSCIFFSLRASFVGAVEIIIYAGAIMVLVMFSMMMFNINISLNPYDTKYTFLSLKVSIGASCLLISLLVILLYPIFIIQNCFINIFASAISLKQIGIMLFGPYMLIVEMASFLLLSALISVLHISQEYKSSTISSVSTKERIL